VGGKPLLNESSHVTQGFSKGASQTVRKRKQERQLGFWDCDTDQKEFTTCTDRNRTKTWGIRSHEERKKGSAL